MQDITTYTNHVKDSTRDAVVLYKSELLTICRLKTAEERDEAFRLFALQALSEEERHSENIGIDMFLSAVYSSQISRRQNHERAKRNGEQGGRPVEIDRNKVFELRGKGFTQQQIANELGCHINSVANILRAGNANPQQPTINDNMGDDPEPEYDDELPF